MSVSASHTGVQVAAIVLDCPEPRKLARFYGELLGWEITEDGDDWVFLAGPAGGVALGFQRDPGYRPPTWPDRKRAQMLHLDFEVDDLAAAHRRAVELGAVLLDDGGGNRGWWVYADPAGHPFCLCRS